MSDNCNILQGVCVLQAAVEAYLQNNSFYNTELNEKLSKSNSVKFVPYDAKADETAKVLVCMRRGPIILEHTGTMGTGTDTVSRKPKLSIRFIISSQSYSLTEALGLELLQFITVISKRIGAYNLNIGTIQLSETQVEPQHSPQFYIATVDLTASIPQVVWQLQANDSIVNSIRFNVNINGQRVLT
jgi:hypothetical protein